jgi:hypothetical protein
MATAVQSERIFIGCDDSHDNKLTFESFNIASVLWNGRPLLGSAGKVMLETTITDRQLKFLMVLLICTAGI